MTEPNERSVLPLNGKRAAVIENMLSRLPEEMATSVYREIIEKLCEYAEFNTCVSGMPSLENGCSSNKKRKYMHYRFSTPMPDKKR